jgi:hypothetical protein
MLSSGVPTEVPISQIKSSNEIIRDTPHHIVKPCDQTLISRDRFLKLLGGFFKDPSVPSELKPFTDFVGQESKSVDQLDNCKSIKILTDNPDQPEMNCTRGESKGKNKCDLFICETKDDSSIVVSYPQIKTNEDLPKIWSLKNKTPDNYMNTLHVFCEGQVIFDQSTKKNKNNRKEFYRNEKSDLLSQSSIYDSKSLEQRYDLKSFKEFEGQEKDCQSEKISNHFQSELKFKRDYSTYLTRDLLATVIEIVNGSLEKSIKERSTLGSEFCDIGQGIFIKGDLNSNQEILSQISEEFQFNQSKDFLEISDSQRLFEDISKLPNMAYNYPLDGCYARAHIIHDFIKKNKGLDCKKIWLQGKYLIPMSAPNVNWSYHVAVSCPIRQADGSVVNKVFDPTTGPSPMTHEQWFNSMNVESPLPTGKTIIEDQSIFSFSISDGNRYQPQDPPGSYDDKLKEARSTLEYYEKN